MYLHNLHGLHDIYLGTICLFSFPRRIWNYSKAKKNLKQDKTVKLECRFAGRSPEVSDCSYWWQGGRFCPLSDDQFSARRQKQIQYVRMTVYGSGAKTDRVGIPVLSETPSYLRCILIIIAKIPVWSRLRHMGAKRSSQTPVPPGVSASMIWSRFGLSATNQIWVEKVQSSDFPQQRNVKWQQNTQHRPELF